jgi:hypothetical protein
MVGTKIEWSGKGEQWMRLLMLYYQEDLAASHLPAKTWFGRYLASSIHHLEGLVAREWNGILSRGKYKRLIQWRDQMNQAKTSTDILQAQAVFLDLLAETLPLTFLEDPSMVKWRAAVHHHIWGLPLP